MLLKAAFMKRSREKKVVLFNYLNKRYHGGSKNPHKMGLKVFDE